MWSKTRPSMGPMPSVSAPFHLLADPFGFVGCPAFNASNCRSAFQDRKHGGSFSNASVIPSASRPVRAQRPLPMDCTVKLIGFIASPV